MADAKLGDIEMRSIRTGTATSANVIRTRALAAITAAALLALSLGTGVASAGDGRDSRNAENTFTKYATTDAPVAPVLFFMAGVVGGDVGDGIYAGEVLSLSVTDTGLVIDAYYRFNGSRHSFTALVHVVQTGFTNGATAVITGQVTEGWLKDNLVKGEYTKIACTQAPDGTCYQGTLDILRGTKAESRPFHLDKTCAGDESEPLGYVCTVQHSDFKWIPAGTKVHYLSQTGNVVSAAIDIRNGSTTGTCVWSSDVDAVCTFGSGTGRLSEFHLSVVVTANADQSIWYWDGTYSFGG